MKAIPQALALNVRRGEIAQAVTSQLMDNSNLSRFQIFKYVFDLAPINRRLRASVCVVLFSLKPGQRLTYCLLVGRWLPWMRTSIWLRVSSSHLRRN
jgi:hypothetical protein